MVTVLPAERHGQRAAFGVKDCGLTRDSLIIPDTMAWMVLTKLGAQFTALSLARRSTALYFTYLQSGLSQRCLSAESGPGSHFDATHTMLTSGP